jgi:hypothetical protein
MPVLAFGDHSWQGGRARLACGTINGSVVTYLDRGMWQWPRTSNGEQTNDKSRLRRCPYRAQHWGPPILLNESNYPIISAGGGSGWRHPTPSTRRRALGKAPPVAGEAALGRAPPYLAGVWFPVRRTDIAELRRTTIGLRFPRLHLRMVQQPGRGLEHTARQVPA